jgi:uncharacterized protein YxjI
MGALLTANTLVVNQRPKLVELTNQYDIHDAHGGELGTIRQQQQRRLRKIARFATSVDQFLTHHLSVYDADDRVLLQVTRPAKLVKSRFAVRAGDGRRVGDIVQDNVFGKIRFSLTGGDGHRLGQIRAENWRAWDFSIVDRDDREVARIDKKFVGVMRAAFTTADNYIVHVDPALDGDLRLLVVAAAAAVDTALKQDPRGLDMTDIADITRIVDI